MKTKKGRSKSESADLRLAQREAQKLRAALGDTKVELHHARVELVRLTELTKTLAAMVRRTAREMSEPKLRDAVLEELAAMLKSEAKS